MELLEQIERYMKVFRVSPTGFGVRAGTGKDLVREMRNGRQPYFPLQQKVQAFLDKEEARFREEYG